MLRSLLEAIYYPDPSIPTQISCDGGLYEHIRPIQIAKVSF